MTMDYKFLEEMMLRWNEQEIYIDDDGYHACTEWLVGTFAGRSFVGKTKRQALKKMCDYFDKTKGTDTVVGRLLVKMGWPSLDTVYQKLFVEGE